MSIATQIRDALARRQRRRFLRTVDSIADIKSRHSDFDELRRQVCGAGTDSQSHFGRDYTYEGGLYLQQNPDEFTSLCLFLRERHPLEHYLEIGSASGGACYFLQQQLGFKQVISLDDGNHRRAAAQDGHFSRIANCHRFLGDSHSEAARSFLRVNMAEKLDVAFIDGDHSYEGVTQDIELTLPYCRSGTLVILHDTVACEGVQRAWKELVGGGRAVAAAEYIGEDAPMGTGIARVL